MSDEKRVMRVPPVLDAAGESLPEAWENAYLALAEKGMVYERDDDEDKGKQVEAVMRVEIRNPDADPFSHKLGGTNAVDSALLDYYYEMMGGKDSWLKKFDDPKDTRWDYTYRERLANYPSQPPIDQIKFAAERLTDRPSSRRTNLITWFPDRDTITRHTPCLQRIWTTVIPSQAGLPPVLDFHYEFRSRNVLKASFGNMHGLYMVFCDIRDHVEASTGQKLDMRILEHVDSYHVNSGDYPTFLSNVARIKKSIKKGEPLAERTMSRDDTVYGLKDAREKVERDILAHTEDVFEEAERNRLGTDYEKKDDDYATGRKPLELPGSSISRLLDKMHAERARVHAIGDRIFYLLDKYSPEKR